MESQIFRSRVNKPRGGANLRVRSHAFGAIVAFCAVYSSYAAGADKVKIAYFRTSWNVAVIEADRKGYFREEGLDVELVLTKDGYDAVEMVGDGTAQLGHAGIAPVMMARARGKKLRMLIGMSSEATDKPIFRLVTTRRAGIASLADLRARSIISENTNGLCELAWRDWLAAVGIPRSEVNFVRTPFSQAQGLLEVGSADAACMPEPFYTAMTLSHDDTVVLASGVLVNEPRPYVIGTLFGDEQWVSQHPAILFKINRALLRAKNELARNPAAFRRLLVEYFDVPAAVALRLKPELELRFDLSMSDILPVVEGMKRTHMLSDEFSANDVVPRPN